jgi:hypothetical protein
MVEDLQRAAVAALAVEHEGAAGVAAVVAVNAITL